MNSVPNFADIEGLSIISSGRGQIQRLVLATLYAHLAEDAIPTNGRFVFYELEGWGAVRKSRKGESRRGGVATPRETEISEALMFLRDAGIIPWSWIEDETRTLHEWNHAQTVAEYIIRAVEVARLNPWASEPPLILTESRSLAGPLRPLAAEYVCPIAATNGMAGGFLRTEVAPILRDNDRPVLYLGDLDKQGFDIERKTRGVLVRESGRSIAWTRIAITQEQVTEHNLKPVWKTDGRDGHPREAVETEALGQARVLGLVRAALDALLPEPLAVVLAREAAQRTNVEAILEAL